MNIQHVSKHGFEQYLAKYISKPESSFDVNSLKILVSQKNISAPE